MRFEPTEGKVVVAGFFVDGLPLNESSPYLMEDLLSSWVRFLGLGTPVDPEKLFEGRELI